MSKTAVLAQKDNEVLKMPEGTPTPIAETGITAIRHGNTLTVHGEVTTNPELLSGTLYFSVRFAAKPLVLVQPLGNIGTSSALWVRANSRTDFQGLDFQRSADTPFRWVAIGEESDVPFDPD